MGQLQGKVIDYDYTQLTIYEHLIYELSKIQTIILHQCFMNENFEDMNNQDTEKY